MNPTPSQTVFRTLSQRPQREWTTPNHALQRTATAVTVAAIPVRSRLVRSGLGLTSVAPFFGSTFAATAPASAVSELGVVSRF